MPNDTPIESQAKQWVAQTPRKLHPAASAGGPEPQTDVNYKGSDSPDLFKGLYSRRWPPKRTNGNG